MTNPSPQDPQNPVPERRKRPATGLTFDEMVAIFVAFTTIGAILFWSLGGRKNKVANNLGLNGSSGLLSGGNFQNQGLGLGNIGLSDTQSELEIAEVELDSAEFTAAPESDSIAVVVPQEVDTVDAKVKPKSSRNSRIARNAVPAAGVAATAGLLNSNNPGNANTVKEKATPKASAPKTGAKPQAKGKAKPQAKAKPKPKAVEVPKDVAPSYWAYPFVKQMSDKALVPDLTEDQNFEPDKLITRAGMATLISQAFDMQPKTEKTKQFQDVSNENAIAADIDKAVRIGFMQGYSEYQFRPLDNIPRYQVLVTLATGLGLKPSGNPEQILQKFENGTDIPDWAKSQVAAAAEAGLIVNRPDFGKSDLKPNESATRAEVAAMIHQALVKDKKLKSLDSEYIVKP